MALNSINTNIGAYYAQKNIGVASNSASLSIARLSSGSRIVRAADDVAAMSAGTSLQTNVTTLKMALINTSQGSSLLQVADGALGQIVDILQRQKAIAVQAGSGSLSSAERSFLNQEFQNLTQEIDRLAGQTNFNGVNLLDGVLSTTVTAVNNETASVKGTASISFQLNATAANSVITINGIDITMALAPANSTQVQIGATIADSVQNLADFLNAVDTNTGFNRAQRLALSAATYRAEGNTLVAEARTGGIGNTFTLGGIVPAAAGTWLGLANAAVMSGSDAGSYYQLFQTNLGVLSTDISAVGAASSAAIPFKATITPTVKVGSAAAVNLLSGALTAGQTLNDIVNDINSRSAIHGVTATIVGSSGSYNIMIKASEPDLDNQATGTTSGGDITITWANATNNAGAAATPTTAANTVHLGRTGLGLNATDTGIGIGDVLGVGVIGDSIIADHSQTKSKVSVIFPDITDAALGSTLAPTALTPLQIDIGSAGNANEFVRFAFSSNTGGTSSTEIAIGATLEETIDNAVAKINAYVGNGLENFALNQVKAYRDGKTLVIESVNVGTVAHIDQNAIAAATASVALQNAPAGVSITNTGNLNNGTTAGVYTGHVTNKDFIGQIQGFSATYNGTANTVNAQITVGGETFTALNVTTNVSSSANSGNIVRFFGNNGGGYFDLTLRVNGGMTVGSQAEANTFSSRLDAAFSTLEFYQNRDVSSYEGVKPIVTDGVVTGSLLGTTLKLNDSDFTDVKINDISVTAPSGSAVDGKISFTINGEEFSAPSDIGTRLSAYQDYKFTSATDANRYLTFSVGGTNIDFNTAAKADAFEAALKEALGVGEGAEALRFQVGTTVNDTLKVSIEGVTAKQIKISDLDVLTQASAAAAADALDLAIDSVTSVRAEVGALQSRFSFAAANVESSIQNQDAARGVLLDTDIAAESTSFATAQVKLQAGIAVLAQANLLQQNLLKLIG